MRKSPTASLDRDTAAVAKRLMRVRSATGLTQTAFAERVGFATRTYLGWERAESAPSIWLLKALKDEFGVAPDWVIDGPEETPRRHSAGFDWERFGRIQDKIYASLTAIGSKPSPAQLAKLAGPIFEDDESKDDANVARLIDVIKTYSKK